jgi:hypothetical protein
MILVIIFELNVFHLRLAKGEMPKRTNHGLTPKELNERYRYFFDDNVCGSPVRCNINVLILLLLW